MSEQSWLWLARVIGLSGLGLLIASSTGGVAMASRAAAKVARRFPRLGGGQLFATHRLLSIIGAGLFLAHPIPMLFAHNTTGGLTLLNVLVPFTAPKQTLWIGLGTLAFYTLLFVTVTSLNMKRMKWVTWRMFHYATYLFFALGLVHGLFISGEFKSGELFEPDEPEKVILLVMATVLFLFPVWRIVAARRKKVAPILL